MSVAGAIGGSMGGGDEMVDVDESRLETVESRADGTKTELVRWGFAADPSAPAAARVLVHDALEGSVDDLDAILLMVSELVTNAVLHTRREAELRLLDLGDGGVRIEVEDQDASEPTPAASAGEFGGFGLRIVSKLARSWGTTMNAAGDRPRHGPGTQRAGKVVWFEVDRYPVASLDTAP